MSTLKQRVPLILDPSPLYINLEWLKDLQAVISEADGGGNSSDLTTLQAKVAALTTQVAALTLTVKKLKDGYQA